MLDLQKDMSPATESEEVVGGTRLSGALLLVLLETPARFSGE